MDSWCWIKRGRNTLALAAVTLVLALAGCTAKAGLPSYGVVGDFTLTDQTGAQFSVNALRGKVWVADFIFTHCMGPCPRMSSQMRQVGEALDAHAPKDSTRLVSFTVDPARDTPEVLAAYGKHFKAEPGRWFFLTGPTETLDHLCRQTFLLGNVDSTLQHSTRFVLIDRHSQIRGFYLSDEAESIPRLIADATRLAKERL